MRRIPNMEYLGADKNNPTLFSLMCESGKFYPHIHPDEADAVNFPCKENVRRNSLTCKDEDIDKDIEDIKSLDMNTADIKGTNLSFKKSILVIPREFFNWPANSIQDKTVAVTIENIFLDNPLQLRDYKYRISKNLNFNQNILHNPVFRNKKVILLFSGRDVLLENLWWNRDSLRLFDSISEIGFTAVTTPNFSVFKGECPLGHAVNIKKGLECGVELEKRGMSVIPNIYSVHKAQIERWSNWLNKHPRIKVIYMNYQLQRMNYTVKGIAVSSLNYLLSKTDVRIILHGADKEILNELGLFKNRVHIANSGILKKIAIMKPSHLSKINLPSKTDLSQILYLSKIGLANI